MIINTKTTITPIRCSFFSFFYCIYFIISSLQSDGKILNFTNWDKSNSFGANLKNSVFGGVGSKQNKAIQADIALLEKYGTKQKGLSAAIQQGTYITKENTKELKSGKISLQDWGKQQVTAANAANRAAAKTKVLNGLISGLGGIIGGLAIGAAIIAATAGIDYLINYSEKLSEKYRDVKEESENLKEEIDNLNSSLATMSDRVEELSSKEKLTFVEQKELEDLREKLDVQRESLEILKEEQRLKQLERQEAADNVASQKTFSIENARGVRGYTPQVELIDSLSERINRYNSLKKSYERDGSVTNSEQNNLDKSMTEVMDIYSQLDEVSEDFSDTYAQKFSQLRSEIAALNNIVEENGVIIEGVTKGSKEAYDKVISTISDSTKKVLSSAYENGELTAEFINANFPELIALLEKYGITVDDILADIDAGAEAWNSTEWKAPSIKWGDLGGETQEFLASIMGFTEETWTKWSETHPLSAEELIDEKSWDSLSADTQRYLTETFGITEDTWNTLVEQNPLAALAIKIQGVTGWDETNEELQALVQKAIDDANATTDQNSLGVPELDQTEIQKRNTEAYDTGVQANESTQAGLDSKDVAVPTPSAPAKQSALTTFKTLGINMIDSLLTGMGIPSPNIVSFVVKGIKNIFSGGDGGSGGIAGALFGGLNDLVTGNLESASVGKTAITSAGITFPTIPGFRGPNKHKNGNQYAMDYPAALGTPIPALQGGTIVRVHTLKGSYGKHIYVAAPDGRTYVYAHMSRFANVKPGQPVRRGQVIGYVGSTGNSTGPHLHYGIAGRASGGIVNPNETTLAGEKGRELAVLPNGKIIMLGESGAGLYDLPPETKVVSNKDTEDVLKYTGKGIINQKVPKFASGNVDSAWVKNAQSIQSKYGIPASLVLAQLILESAWGTSDLAKNANNYFGMKGTGTAGRYGQYQKYNSMEESFEAYAKNLLNSGYYNVSGLGANDFTGWIDSIAETYAPNQGYATKVKNVASSYNLTQYDTGGTSSTSSSSSDESYQAEIDKYYKYQLALDDINTQLERNDKLEANAGENLTRKLKVLADNIKLTEQEKSALVDIANVKREDLKKQIEELRALGYDIAYNPETNYLSIQNYELLESLTGDTAKNQEEMIKNMIDLNKEIIEHSDAWWEAENSIKEYINAMKEAREEQLQLSKDIFQEFQESYINQYQYMIDDLEWAKENDELIKSLQEQLDILEKQEAVLNGANEARAEAIALQKAEEALAKQQENIRIYREGQGFVYEKDQSEAKELEEEYSDAKLAYEQAKIEAQIEAQEKIYDDAINELQGVIDSWEHAIDVSNREQAMTIEEYVEKLKEYGLDTAENINKGVLWLEQAINTTNVVSDSINSMLNPIGANVEALKNLTNCLGGVQSALNELLNKAPEIDNGLIEEGQDYNSIVRSAMQKSNEWLSSTDPNEKAKLHEEVMNILHNQLGLNEADNYNASTGVWYGKDGNALYDTQRSLIVSEMQANSAEWQTADATRKQELWALNQQLGSLARFTYDSSAGVWRTSDGALAYLLPHKDKIAQMKQNSLDWYSASDSERVRLSNENMNLGNSIGLTYKDGVWYYQGQPVYTLTQEDFLNAMKSNSAQWAAASQSEKDRLSKGNQTLAAVYNSRFSDKLTHDSGTGIWYRSDGTRAFRDGGVVDYTGLANVHGSNSNPELILNSNDVGKLYDYIHNTPSLVSNMIAGITSKSLEAKNENRSSAGDVIFNFNDGVHLHEVSSAEEVWDALCNDLPRIARQELMKRRK